MGSGPGPLASLHHTFVGGYLVHAALITPWIAGFVLYVGLAAWSTHSHFAGAALAALVSYEYGFPHKEWPELRQLIKDLNPRCYFREQPQLILPSKTLAQTKTMLCYHPHGALTLGFSWNGAHAPELVEFDATYLVHDTLFLLPLFGTVLRWLGNIKGASAGSMGKLMSAGRNVVIMPGGFEDATLLKYGVERIYLRKRAGFIKFALRHGYKVHPVYTFGESDTYVTFSKCIDFRLLLNKYKLPALVFWGNPVSPLLPRADARVLTVIGAALDLPQIDEPTAGDVAKYHALYVDALQALFEAHKVAAGKAGETLEVW